MATREPLYALGHSEQELERLARQGRAFGPFTKALFAQAGITRGMHILDVGCGSGDVAFLAAEFVGAEGKVVGVDRAAEAVSWARARCDSFGSKNVHFVQGDPTAMGFDRAFDAAVGRLVLMYYPDPGEALRQVARHVRPDGLVVFQEIDILNCRTFPNSPLLKQCRDWIMSTFERTGARPRMGLELFRFYRSAGLPAPSLRHDAWIAGGPEPAPYEWLAGVVRSLLPAMEQVGVASADEVGISTLAERLRADVVASGGVFVSPALIGAWSRKAA